MNKLDRYDTKKMIEAKKIIESVANYNYTSESDSLVRKLNTIINKINRVLDTELEPKLQEEYNFFGKV